MFEIRNLYGRCRAALAGLAVMAVMTGVAVQGAHAADGPASTRGSAWVYVVNNAIRTADAYAAQRNPQATAAGRPEVGFVEQVAGVHKGRYLLRVFNQHGGGQSLFMLLPLFDERAPSDALDDEAVLWRVVQAKHNGAEF